VRPGLVRKRRAAKVALTFDDGPSQWTHPILDLLADHDARATFFAVGANIPGNAGVVERAHAEGHLLGNHTTNHPDLTQLTLAEAARELAETTLMLDAATGGTTVYWRAPYLRRPRVLSTPGLIHIGCDVVPEDWMESDADVICKRVLASCGHRSIVLLHDGRPPGQPTHAEGGSLDSRDQTVAALAQLLPALLERGFELVTVANL